MTDFWDTSLVIARSLYVITSVRLDGQLFLSALIRIICVIRVSFLGLLSSLLLLATVPAVRYTFASLGAATIRQPIGDRILFSKC